MHPELVRDVFILVRPVVRTGAETATRLGTLQLLSYEAVHGTQAVQQRVVVFLVERQSSQSHLQEGTHSVCMASLAVVLLRGFQETGVVDACVGLELVGLLCNLVQLA